VRGPPSPQHDHLAKYSFSKEVKSQVKLKLEVSQKLTNEDLERLVKDSPNGIEPKTEEITQEIPSTPGPSAVVFGRVP
jgi:hypothetical protein